MCRLLPELLTLHPGHALTPSAAQILCIDIVTEGMPAVNFVQGPPDGRRVLHPPTDATACGSTA